jgi:hypothetical protein
VLNASLSPGDDGFVAARWDTSKTVEGQDRLGSKLIVAELGRGPAGQFNGSVPALHLFEDIDDQVARGALQPTGSVDLSAHIDAILHVKFLARNGDLFAVCSGGFATTTFGAVVVVNVTDIAHAQVTVLSTPVAQPEGVMIVNSTVALVGGISSSALATIDLTDPMNPSLVSTMDGIGAQLVAAKHDDQPVPSSTSATMVYMANWGTPGGLVVVDAADPFQPRVVAETSALALSKSNRVKLFDHYAAMPLELKVGGFALVDLDDVAQFAVHHVEPELQVNTKAYCLVVTADSRLFLFIAETSTLMVYSLE